MSIIRNLYPNTQITHTAKRVTLLDLLALLDADFDDDTRHGRADGSRVRGGPLARDGLDGRVLVVDGDGTDLAVDLEPDIALSTTLNHGADSHEADDERLALLDGNVHLLADVGAAEEVASGNDAARSSVQASSIQSRRRRAHLRSPNFSTKLWYSSKTWIHIALSS